MKIKILFFLIVFSQPIIGQVESEQNLETPQNTESQQIDKIPKEDFERPFNYFAAAGPAFRFGNLYDVTVSPIDYTVQFEDVFLIHTRFSMGLVWNPFQDNSKENIIEYSKNKLLNFKAGSLADRSVEAARRHTAVALLVNIAQLTFASGEVNTTSPIDVGFGLGYRNDKFLILGTLEFTPRDKDRSLFLAQSQEPVRTISIEDDALFTSNIFVSIGLKVAYTFTKPKK
jgi:hypothetical protein